MIAQNGCVIHRPDINGPIGRRVLEENVAEVIAVEITLSVLRLESEIPVCHLLPAHQRDGVGWGCDIACGRHRAFHVDARGQVVEAIKATVCAVGCCCLMTIRVQQIDLDAIEAYAAGRDMAADMSWCEVAFIELGGRAILDDDIAHDKIAIAVQRSQIRQVSLGYME